MDDATPFEVVLVHLDGYLRVKLRGEMDYPALISDQGATLQAVTHSRERVVIDLSEVTFMDSSGIAILVNIGRQHDGPLRLEGVQSAVRKILEVSGLTELFDIGG
ncbi:MAG: STAS domain-containing protein [Actinomycetota bacterium]|nr:STAS domain-containing protein [Actinomycetota bacterium]